MKDKKRKSCFVICVIATLCLFYSLNYAAEPNQPEPNQPSQTTTNNTEVKTSPYKYIGEGYCSTPNCPGGHEERCYRIAVGTKPTSAEPIRSSSIKASRPRTCSSIRSGIKGRYGNHNNRQRVESNNNSATLEKRISQVFSEEPRVIVYTFKGCGFCDLLMKDLTERDIKFEAIDILKPGNEAARREMERKSHQGGVPVLDINGEIVVGYDLPKKIRVNNLITKYFPRVVLVTNTAELTMIFAKSQQYVDGAEANSVLGKCFEAHKARLIYKLCLTSELTKAAEKSFLPNQKMAVITVAKNTAFNNCKSALVEFRKICKNNPIVRKVRFAWDKAANESGSIDLQWVGLFGVSIPQDQYSAFQIQTMQQENAESFAAIRAEAERILGTFEALFEPIKTEQQLAQKEEVPAQISMSMD